MSKLFKLKEWLTVEETANHLSMVLGESVAVADIYRLALDKHLILSMSFPNHTYGNLGTVVGIENTKRFKPPLDLFKSIHGSDVENIDEEIIISDYIGNEQFINWDEKVVSIDGVWDLAMHASERIDVEYIYHQLIGGPKIDLVGIDGAFVKRGECFCRLVESFDENPYKSGSEAARRDVESFIAMNELPLERISEIWERYEQERKKYLEEKKASPYENDFYPAGGLPKDGVYVVRTAAIMDFLSSIDDAPKQLDKPLSTKERNSMISIIAALCQEAKIDYNQRGIAGALAKTTEVLGSPLSEDTVRNILKQVKEQFN